MVHRAFAIEERNKMTVRWDADGYIIHCEFPNISEGMIMKDINAILPHIRLRFNIEHPTIEESYCFGYECALTELDIDENPFLKGSLSYEYWQEGWWAGFYGEQPLFESKNLDEAGSLGIEAAANDAKYRQDGNTSLRKWLKITGALAASAIVGYQILDMVA